MIDSAEEMWAKAEAYRQQHPEDIGDGRLLTNEEMARAKADRAAASARSRSRPGPKSEGLALRFYSGLKIQLRKQSVATNILDRRGNPIRRSIDVDYVGSIGLNGQAVVFKTEVKAVTEGHLPLSRISDIQRGYLNKSLKMGAVTVLTIVWWTKIDPRMDETVTVLFPVPWADWLGIEDVLRGKARGNYKGNSFRTTDLPLLNPYGILKVNGRWSLKPEHWLYRLLHQSEEEVVCQTPLL